MRTFRIADRRHAIFDGTGAKLLGGRWNSPGRAVIYASESFSLALLEVLVHANLNRPPKTHAVVEIAIPDEVSVETVSLAAGFHEQGLEQARAFGDRWLLEGRSCVLLAPSAVVGGRERNVLINPAHAEFAGIQASPPQEFLWDERLFRPPG